MKRFNDWLAIKIVSGVATMWCAYAFAILAVLGFPVHGNTTMYIQWISQTFIQLTMLSVIMVGQDLMAKQSKDHHEEHMKHIKKIHNKIGIKND